MAPVNPTATTNLGDFDGRRDNNFTALRLFFAWLVLYGHSFPITGNVGGDPLRTIFAGSIWSGELAVSGFFAISGFLVAASFVRRGLKDYLLSRVLRIYPALIICVGLTVLIAGPLLSQLSASAYYSDTKTWSYLYNATALFPMQFQLPGVFTENARPAVNGSLWTLTLEVSCYVLLAGAGVLGLLRSRAVTNLLAVSLVLIAISNFADFPLVGRRDNWSGPALYFLLGVMFYANRGQIELRPVYAVGAAILAYLAFGESWFHFVFPPAFVYLSFYLAYRTKHLGLDESLGDISYGVYIYAWPVQQVLALAYPNMSVFWHVVLATLIVSAMSFASWRLIEKPALGLKRRLLAI